MEMIERISDTLARFEDEDITAPVAVRRERAIRVLEAMREPTSAMVEATIEPLGDIYPDDHNRSLVHKEYVQMIDAALGVSSSSHEAVQAVVPPRAANIVSLPLKEEDLVVVEGPGWSCGVNERNGNDFDPEIAADGLTAACPMLLERVSQELDVSAATARTLMGELMKFLYVCSLGEGVMTPSKIVDEVWHTFIIFTKHYREFCLTQFGRFIDHNPSDDTDANANQYEATIAQLLKHFGSAPKEYWPRGKVITDIETGFCSNI